MKMAMMPILLEVMSEINYYKEKAMISIYVPVPPLKKY